MRCPGLVKTKTGILTNWILDACKTEGRTLFRIRQTNTQTFTINATQSRGLGRHSKWRLRTLSRSRDDVMWTPATLRATSPFDLSALSSPRPLSLVIGQLGLFRKAKCTYRPIAAQLWAIAEQSAAAVIGKVYCNLAQLFKCGHFSLVD